MSTKNVEIPRKGPKARDIKHVNTLIAHIARTKASRSKYQTIKRIEISYDDILIDSFSFKFLKRIPDLSDIDDIDVNDVSDSIDAKTHTIESLFNCGFDGCNCNGYGRCSNNKLCSGWEAVANAQLLTDPPASLVCKCVICSCYYTVDAATNCMYRKSECDCPSTICCGVCQVGLIDPID